ncbi:MAG: stage II sporulation protein M [Bacteroidetes bacterium]|nr:stage II sporulation protein M [Bacteroidota bacterium]
MKETQFINKNKHKWQEFEKLLTDSNADSDKLSSLFIETTHDLSYARTFYNNRSIKVYINNVAQKIIYELYKHKSKNIFSSIKHFWTDELPQIIVHCRREFIISTFIFLLSVCIGVFCTVYDETFTTNILGSNYVNMTQENIAKGDPMAVYKQPGQVSMFFQITLNNIWVAFITFIGGALLGVGTIASLLANGIMLGTFQYFFIQRGLFIESFSTIWLHGTIEISSIVIAGAAGLVLGKGIAIPETYTRAQSLYIHGVLSLKILAGTIPLFIFAGFIESFITRYSETPLFVKFLLIGLSGAFIIGYYVYFPYKKKKSGFEKTLQFNKIKPFNYTWDFSKIKTTGEIIYETFVFLRIYSSAIIKAILVLSIILIPAFHYTLDETQTIRFNTVISISNTLDELFRDLNFSNPYFMASAIVVAISISSFLHFKFSSLRNRVNNNKMKAIGLIFSNALIISFLCLFIQETSITISLFLLSLYTSCSLFITTGISTEDAPLIERIKKSFSLLTKSISAFIPVFLILFICSIALFMGFQSSLDFLWSRFLNTSVDGDNFVRISRFIHYLLTGATLCFVLLLPSIGFLFIYFSEKERVSATSLLQRIEKLAIHEK